RAVRPPSPHCALHRFPLALQAQHPAFLNNVRVDWLAGPIPCNSTAHYRPPPLWHPAFSSPALRIAHARIFPDTSKPSDSTPPAPVPALLPSATTALLSSALDRPPSAPGSTANRPPTSWQSLLRAGRVRSKSHQ